MKPLGGLLEFVEGWCWGRSGRTRGSRTLKLARPRQRGTSQPGA
jgi:hypothetical protein